MLEEELAHVALTLQKGLAFDLPKWEALWRWCRLSGAFGQ
jgi:hypothetical protein